MRRIHEYIIVLLLCCMSAPVWSQDGEQAAVSTREQRELNKILNTPVPHKYKFWDNLFFGGSFGANYSLSEYVRQENFFKMLRPQVDLSFGKYMNKSIAMRVGFFFMSQEASIPQDPLEITFICLVQPVHQSFQLLAGMHLRILSQIASDNLFHVEVF